MNCPGSFQQLKIIIRSPRQDYNLTEGYEVCFYLTVSVSRMSNIELADAELVVAERISEASMFVAATCL